MQKKKEKEKKIVPCSVWGFSLESAISTERDKGFTIYTLSINTDSESQFFCL